MSIFFTDAEIEIINKKISLPEYSNLYWGILNRVQKYCDSPGLADFNTNTDWWHHATEYLSEAAWVYKFTHKNDKLKNWLRSVTLELIERSDDDWIGPFFRNHQNTPPCGNLETAHLSIAVSLVLDLCPEIFSVEELKKIKEKLTHSVIPLCMNWLKNNHHLANWRCILLAGVAVSAAVIDDCKTLDYVLEEYKLCMNVVQPDGSYAESLQYGNYCYWGLMFTYESLVRNNFELRNDVSVEPYSKAIKWFVHSFFYNKTLDGWGAYPVPRSANFNDSAAVFGADPDLLMHISARMKKAMPEEAGLARWMFDKLYTPYPNQGPFDRNTFGFFNRYSFFSMIFYLQSAEAITPEEIKLPLSARYTNGDCLARNSWETGKTILAFRGAPDKLYAPGHLHADLNSLILVHNKERLLADPGHSCYRNSIHEYECSSKAHNTCTFILPDGRELQQQKSVDRRILEADKVSSPVERKAKYLIAERIDEVTVFASDAGESYGEPIKKFERFCILCSEHVLFIVDRIESSEPVRVNWNWLLNNRDGQLEYKIAGADKMVVRRGNAGMKLFHLGDTSLSRPVYGYIHDAYHPLPQQLGEGSQESGIHFVWSSDKAAIYFQRIHAVALDTYGLVAGWHLINEPDGSSSWEGKEEAWNLNMQKDKFIITEKKSNRIYNVSLIDDKWNLSK